MYINLVFCSSFMSSFLKCVTFISFSYLITLARTSHMALNRGDTREYSCLFPILVGKCPVLSLYRMLAVGCLKMFFIILRKFIFIPSCRDFLPWILDLSNAFPVTIDRIVWFSYISLMMWWLTLINFWILNQLCILRINPTWSLYIIIFIYSWIWLILCWGFCSYIHVSVEL